MFYSIWPMICRCVVSLQSVGHVLMPFLWQADIYFICKQWKKDWLIKWNCCLFCFAFFLTERDQSINFPFRMKRRERHCMQLLTVERVNASVFSLLVVRFCNSMCCKQFRIKPVQESTSACSLCLHWTCDYDFQVPEWIQKTTNGWRHSIARAHQAAW